MTAKKVLGLVAVMALLVVTVMPAVAAEETFRLDSPGCTT